MLKIFLVEDEVIVREGIRKKIDWEKEGFIFSGEASDGELALPMILDCKPDVIITDIKMPFMDGLELSRLIKAELLWVKIIVLSGFDDFDYAKQAIEIGVTEYLLKPISKDKILETVRRVKNIIEAEQNQREMMSRFEESKKDMVKTDKLRLLEKLVMSGSSVCSLIESAKQLEIDIIAKVYTVILFRYVCQKKGASAEERLGEIKEDIESLYKNDESVILFDRGMDDFVIILKNENKEVGTKRAYEISEDLGDLIIDDNNISCFISVSDTTTRLGELPKLYSETANRLFYQYLVSKESSPFVVGDYFSDRILLTSDNLNIDAMNKKNVGDFLKDGNIQDVPAFIESYFKNVGENNLESLIFRQYIIMDIQIIALGFLKEFGIDSSAVSRDYSTKELSVAFATLNSTKVFISEFLEDVFKIRGEKILRAHSSWLYTAKEYIDLNFCDKELSLKKIADIVGVTPSHFSAVFSQEIGSTFIEHLTNARIERAKELLMFTNKKSSAIADEVGYNDPHYFSQLFKKNAGISPIIYRTNNQEDLK